MITSKVILQKIMTYGHLLVPVFMIVLTILRNKERHKMSNFVIDVNPDTLDEFCDVMDAVQDAYVAEIEKFASTHKVPTCCALDVLELRCYSII